MAQGWDTAHDTALMLTADPAQSPLQYSLGGTIWNTHTRKLVNQSHGMSLSTPSLRPSIPSPCSLPQTIDPLSMFPPSDHRSPLYVPSLRPSIPSPCSLPQTIDPLSMFPPSDHRSPLHVPSLRPSIPSPCSLPQAIDPPPHILSMFPPSGHISPPHTLSMFPPSGH